MPSPYATDEPAELLWLEQSTFVAAHIAAVAYGVHAIVYFYCVHYILRAKQRSWFSLVYISILFVLASINLACNISFNEKVWIDERNYPTGPLGYLSEMQNISSNTLGNSATSITGAMADALLIWRCYIIWSKRWYIIVLPVMGLISASVLTSLTVYQASRPFGTLWGEETARYGTPYWGILCALNITVTLLMVVRLLWTRRRIQEMLGPEHSKVYVDLSSMIVESALPYALVSFVYVILYGTGNTAQNLLLPLFAQVQCIAPELIVLRVSRGRAWDSTTATTGGVNLPSSSNRSPNSSNPSSQSPSDPTSKPSSTRMPRFAFPSRPKRSQNTTTLGTISGTLDSESAMRMGMSEVKEEGDIPQGLYDVSMVTFRNNRSSASVGGVSEGETRGKKDASALV